MNETWLGLATALGTAFAAVGAAVAWVWRGVAAIVARDQAGRAV